MGIPACTAPEKRTPDLLLQEFTGELDPIDRSSGGYRQAYGMAVDALIPGMAADSVPDRETPQQQLQTMVIRASAPGHERQRAALSRAIATRLGGDTPLEARVWMLRQLERIGDGEVVAALERLLDDDHPRIRESARRAMQHNPDDDAGEALLDALIDADDAEWQVALIAALAARRETHAVDDLIELAYDRNPDVAVAAIAALGDIATDDAVDALYEFLGDLPELETIVDALLRAAQRVAADGKSQRAKSIYANIFQLDLPVHLRIGALEGLADLGGGRGLTELLFAIRRDADPNVRVAAARALERFPDSRVTRALVDELLIADPADPLLIIETLGRRGDRGALPTIIALTGVGDEEIRVAALNAMKHLGNETVVLHLAWTATQTEGEEQAAARSSLDHLRDDAVDGVIVQSLKAYDEMPRAELIRAVRARRITDAVPLIFEHTLHADETVRIAALETLAELAGEDLLPSLVLHLVGPLSDEEREAAEDAVVNVCGRVEDHAACTTPIVQATPKTDSPVRVSMIRVLGRVRGEDALEPIRDALASSDEDVRDAAVRALADWDDVQAADDLVALISTSESEVHKILALRGYVRLVRETESLDAETRLEMLDRIAPDVDRIEDKRLLLSAWGEVNHPEAIARVAEFLSGELHDEAVVATIKIARLISGLHRDAATAALDRIAALEVTEDAAKQLTDARGFIERYEGYITDWEYAGPYYEESMKAADIFDHPFPPEPEPRLEARAASPEPRASARATDPNQENDNNSANAAHLEPIEWQPLPITTPAAPWKFDLAEAIGGDHRCVYVRTTIDAPDRREVNLEIGSDDGVRAWLNDQLIHTNDTHRGVTIADDVVPATLEPGPNTLMLKITNGTGGWGFACGINSPDNHDDEQN